MAKKKTKRPNLSQSTLERARAERLGERAEAVVGTDGENVSSAVTASAAAKPKTKRAPSLATRRIPSTEELLAEYAYVLKDLRNLAILAGLLFLVIIAAAIALPRITG
jgi:hypothetical protein